MTKDAKSTHQNETLSNLLKRVGANSIDSLSFEQTKKVFLLSTDMFLHEEICLDELSSIASGLLYFPHETTQDAEEELSSALLAGSELSFYVRKIPETESKTGNFISFITEVKDYFEKYKDEASC